MAIANTVVQVTYQGNNATLNFSITQDIIMSDSGEIKVYLRDESDPTAITETLQVEGALQDYTLTGANPPSQPFDDTVSFNVAPSATKVIIIRRELPLTQTVDLDGNSAYPAEATEKGLDRIVAMIQQLNNRFNRVMQLTAYANPDFPSGVMMPQPEADGILAWDATGQNLIYLSPAELALLATGGAGTLGLPTDGIYGGPDGPIAGVAELDLVEDAFDKIETLLGLIAPVPPAALSAKTLTIPGAYTALAETTGASHYCTDDTTPIVTPGQTAVIGNSFRNADAGTLSAEMDNVSIGSIPLTTGDDTGVNGELEILFDFDPYLAMTGAGIYKALVARINSAVLTVGQHIAEMIHTLTGTATLTFYVDDPGVSVISSKTLTTSGTSSFKSGVPGIAAGQTLRVQFLVDNAVNTHYNSTRIGSASGSQVSTVNETLPGTPPADNAQVAIDVDVVVQSNAYSEDVSVSCNAYNSKGTLVTSAVTNNIRVDTVGSESARFQSSTGQYPATNYNLAYDSTTSIGLTYDLQYLNGAFRYPPAVNYTGKTPAGPNYSALSSDPHNSMRWAVFSLGSISSASFVTFTISGTSGFGSSAVVTGIELYLRVDGATPTTGWLDANTAYPGVGNPTADGDDALDVGSSTATSKRVTFGAAVKTGTVYVRIGIPSGSTKTFTGIS